MTLVAIALMPYLAGTREPDVRRSGAGTREPDVRRRSGTGTQDLDVRRRTGECPASRQTAPDSWYSLRPLALPLLHGMQDGCSETAW